MADRGPDGETPPAWYSKACFTCLFEDTRSGDIDTNALLQQDDDASLRASFVKRVQAVCWNRTFIECRQGDRYNRLVGIGPGDSQAEDIVCILYGLSVPCILRPIRRSTGDEHNFDYQLVGEAFILDQMDGEALFNLSEQDLAGEDFRII